MTSTRHSCAELDAGETTEEEGEITYGEFSAGLQLFIGLLASVNPPQEVSDWHNTLLTSQRELKAAIDEYPGSKDDPIDIERFFTLLVAYHEGLSKAARDLDPALRDWLIAAGCMDEDLAAASFDAWPDGGNGVIEREELTVGVGVEGALDETSETDYFIFRAEAGKEYLIEAVWEGDLLHPPGNLGWGDLFQDQRQQPATIAGLMDSPGIRRIPPECHSGRRFGRGRRQLYRLRQRTDNGVTRNVRTDSYALPNRDVNSLARG